MRPILFECTQNIGDVIVAEILSNPMKLIWFKQNSILKVVGAGIGQRILIDNPYRFPVP